MAFKIEHLHIKSPDPRKTVNWWVENVGAKIELEDDAGKHYRLDLGGVRLVVTPLISTQTRKQHYGLEHLRISTDDFENQVKKIKASGVHVLEESRSGRHGLIFRVETPEGVELDFGDVSLGD